MQRDRVPIYRHAMVLLHEMRWYAFNWINNFVVLTYSTHAKLELSFVHIKGNSGNHVETHVKTIVEILKLPTVTIVSKL